MSLLGFDLSHHNGVSAVDTLLKKYPDHCDFFMLKVTEGTTWIDPNYLKFLTLINQKNILFGLYHFCRADRGNSAEKEATHFVSQVKHFIGKCMLIADYEGDSLKHGQEWLYNFCVEVHRQTGVKPLVYLQYADLKHYGKVAQGDFGLWCAKWGSRPQFTTPWKTMAMWQYTNRYEKQNLDANIFYGTKTQFLKYCEISTPITKPPEEKPEDGKCFCGCSCCSE